MDDFDVLRSSEVEPNTLQRLLADHLAEQQVRDFRRFFLVRLALIIAAAWLFSWPVHLLPHTVVWGLLATTALVIGLTWPSRTHPTSPGMHPTPQR
jgi:hypothetical protein